LFHFIYLTFVLYHVVIVVLQTILRQLGQLSNEPLMADESELECYHKLQKLYTSTKTAKVYLYSQSIYLLSLESFRLVKFLTKVMLTAFSAAYCSWY
jgi:hypothetical protein